MSKSWYGLTKQLISIAEGNGLLDFFVQITCK